MKKICMLTYALQNGELISMIVKVETETKSLRSNRIAIKNGVEIPSIF